MADPGLPTTEARTEQTDHKAHIQDNLSEGVTAKLAADLAELLDEDDAVAVVDLLWEHGLLPVADNEGWYAHVTDLRTGELRIEGPIAPVSPNAFRVPTSLTVTYEPATKECVECGLPFLARLAVRNDYPDERVWCSEECMATTGERQGMGT